MRAKKKEEKKREKGEKKKKNTSPGFLLQRPAALENRSGEHPPTTLPAGLELGCGVGIVGLAAVSGYFGRGRLPGMVYIKTNYMKK